MGRRGPTPQPTALRIAKGNPSKRPLNKREPQPEKGRPRCPQWVDDYAKACWKQVVPELERLGVLTRIDGQALTNYCVAWSRWKQAEEFLQKHGSVIPIKDDNGKLRYLQQVPQVAIARTLMQVLNRYQQDFGLTPSARTRIQVPADARPKDDFDRFLERKHGG